MLLMDTKLAQEGITRAKNRKSTWAIYKDNHYKEGFRIDLYFLTFGNELYRIAGIQYPDEKEEKYYMLHDDDFETTIFPYTEMNEVLDGLTDTLKELVDFLKKDKESN